jgi:hypothetical protein
MMKNKLTAFLFFLTLSCQGPWSYWPDNPENYQGVWTYAYIISGRPVEEVCFDKMHALTEVRLPGFAFYDEASIKVAGTFSGRDTSFFLEPKSGKPNCFFGPQNLIAESGKNYELNVSMVWDSAGRKTTSHFSAKTYIPEKFKVKWAYDLKKERYKNGDTILYLPPPKDMQSNYYIPEYSDDVGGVLVSMIFPADVYWGENSLDRIVEQFSDASDTARHARFGDRYTVFSAANQSTAGMNKAIDSIPVIGMRMPAVGSFKLLFYATTSDYFKFRETFVQGSDDSRVQAIYNINGGAGIFAGMMVDTFEVNIKTEPDVKVYSYEDAQEARCSEDDEDGNKRLRSRRQCVELWDKEIWREIICGNPEDEDYDEECEVEEYPPWYEIPSDSLKEILEMPEIQSWCEYRYFPIDIYPLCGSALVYYSKVDGKSSAILDREVKKWCEEHKDDEECADL